MKKANVIKINTMAEDYLQYRYSIYLRAKATGDQQAIENTWMVYEASYAMLEAFGAMWWRHYHGGDTEDIGNYSHTVEFPSDTKCEKLNVDAWK